MIEPTDSSRPIFRSHAYMGSTVECFGAVRRPEINWVLWQHENDAGQQLSDALKPLAKTDRFARHALEYGPIRLPLYRFDALPSARTLSKLLSKCLPGLEIIADPLSILFAACGQYVAQERRRAIKSEVRLQIGAAGDLLFHMDEKKSESEVRLIMSCHGPGVECLDHAGAIYGPSNMARARSEAFIYRTRSGDVSLMKNNLHRTPPGCDPETNARVVVVMDSSDERPTFQLWGRLRQRVGRMLG